MFSDIADAISKIVDFFNSVVNFVVGLIHDIVDFIKMVGDYSKQFIELVSEIFPPQLLVLVIAIISLAVILRIVGRD